MRRDLPGAPEIAASFDNISQTNHATVLSENGASVSTTEHLLAALWMNGISHCRIEIDGPEIPILDGSARDWQRLLDGAEIVEVKNESAAKSFSTNPKNENSINRIAEIIAPNADTEDAKYGSNFAKLGAKNRGAAEIIAEKKPDESDFSPSSTRLDNVNTENASLKNARPVFGLREAVWVESGASSVLALPCDHLRVSVFADFGLSYIAPTWFDGQLSREFFAREIASARTFTLEKWIEPLRAQGLIAGGSVENAIVLGENAPSSPLRFRDELARHKALDLLGDVALLCAPHGGILRAHFVAVRAGHSLHQMWMARCRETSALVRLN